VANAASGTVTPITLATGRSGPPVRVRGYPLALAVTPDGRTVYAVSWLAGTVTPITVGPNRAGQPIRTGSYPVAITMAPGGRTAYVVNFGSNTVTPVSTSTNTADARSRPAGPQSDRHHARRPHGLRPMATPTCSPRSAWPPEPPADPGRLLFTTAVPRPAAGPCWR
jgi:DNA-binding beta-propeller fold protein YncE